MTNKDLVTVSPHVEILLSHRGEQRVVALVDSQDAQMLSEYRWHWMTRKGHSGYALAMSKIGGRTVSTLMHRLIMGLKPGNPVQADHRNSDGLDNRRANLRLATQTENVRNRRKIVGVTGFKGVFRNDSVANPFFAMCARQYLGVFTTAIDAARAYDIAARAKYGEFAATNAELVADRMTPFFCPPPAFRKVVRRKNQTGLVDKS